MINLDCGRLSQKIEVLSAFSYALHNAGLGTVLRVVAENKGQSLTEAVQGRASLEEPLGIWQWDLPALQPGESVSRVPRLESLDYDALERVTTPSWSTLTLEMGRETVKRDLLLLGSWQWPLHPATWPSLAGFVLPYDGVIRGILSAAQEAQPDSRAGSTQKGSMPLALSILRSLYLYLERSCRIRFAEPMAVVYERNVGFQVIRPPHRVLFNIGNREGEGNCLDLSLFVAGLLEAAGFAPLVLLAGGVGDPATHAMLGVWSDGRARFHPIIREKMSIESLIETGELVVLEATGVCSGSRHLGFEAAVEQGRRAVSGAAQVHAVDVKTLRPPLGHVLSMETPLDPVVLLALHEASSLAYRLQSPAFETLHLLYGLAAAGGEVLRGLSGRGRLSQGRLAEEVIHQLQKRKKGHPTGHTVGYDRCVNDARENARSQGSTVVRECDLWWAILLNDSRSVDQSLLQAGSPRRELMETLSAICPQTRPQTQNF